MLSFNFFTIEDDNVTDLMHWGRKLTILRREEALQSLKEEKVVTEFMVIPEQKFDDRHELVIKGTIANNRVRRPNMRRKFNRDHREITHRLLTQLEEPPEQFTLAGAVIIYFLTTQLLNATASPK